jgi:hypothetical protein
MKNYKEWLSESESSTSMSIDEIGEICKKLNIHHWKLDDEGFVNVNGNVYLADLKRKNIVGIPFKFGKVSGDFFCEGAGLTTLEGSPREIRGNFWCSQNKLVSLKGGPEKVGGNYVCSENKLTSLEGVPEIINRDFVCNKNKLTTLKGGPKEVKGYYDCSFNKLVNLEGLPEKVYSLYCQNSESDSKLVSLKGCPEVIDGDFKCDGNKLKNLEFAPKKINGDFLVYQNPLVTLKGGPLVSGQFKFHTASLNDEEVDAYDELGHDLFFKWISTGMTLEDFKSKHRGTLTGKKFGI